MQLFVFSSMSIENIRRGIAAKTWAIRNDSPPSKAKARRYLGKGTHGLFYCSEKKCFTTPFIATSSADPHGRVDTIWDETWYLPFGIEPLGDLRRQVPKDLAKVIWRPLLINYVGGRTVFSPIPIDDEDWESIRHHLANDMPAHLSEAAGTGARLEQVSREPNANEPAP